MPLPLLGLQLRGTIGEPAIDVSARVCAYAYTSSGALLAVTSGHIGDRYAELDGRRAELVCRVHPREAVMIVTAASTSVPAVTVAEEGYGARGPQPIRVLCGVGVFSLEGRAGDAADRHPLPLSDELAICLLSGSRGPCFGLSDSVRLSMLCDDGRVRLTLSSRDSYGRE